MPIPLLPPNHLPLLIGMDDIVIEETMTYVARELGPMYTIETSALQKDQSNLSDIMSGNAVKGMRTDIIRP